VASPDRQPGAAAHRLCHPREHSLFLRWQQYVLRFRISLQEHLALVGPPRPWKSAPLRWLIMESPRPVVSASSKPDVFALTSGVGGAAIAGERFDRCDLCGASERAT